ncbi:RICIN domain-containing protein [Embleya sp. NPDC059267]|uniref:RICIN domain-containing protein n=2 Tax=unclassified Embleya TaxID=2699296 RepID=UPI0033E98DDC
MPSIRFLRAPLGAMGALALATTMMATPSTADPAPGGTAPIIVWKTHTFKNVFSQRCLEIRGDRTDNGAPAGQWECNHSHTQNWIAKYGPNGYYTLVNVNSGLCLEIRGDRTDDGAPAGQWECNGSRTQEWRAIPHNSDGEDIVNANSDKCLEILSWGTGDGDAAGQWTCHGGENQRWYGTVYP